MEMQKVAQAVTFENQLLRDLLGKHGISQDEIHRYISSPPAPVVTKPTRLAAPGTLKCKACGSTSIMLETQPDTSSSGNSFKNPNRQPNVTKYSQPSPSVSPEAIEDPRKFAPGTATAASQQARFIDRGTDSQFQEYRYAQYHTPRSNGDRVQYGDTSLQFQSSAVTQHAPSTEHYASHSSSESSNLVDNMETSCDAAASILVDLHHHADAERARLALGCEGPNNCTVKNIKIFQLLDHFS